ncbi:hypothetical protein BVF91_09665 [Thermoanaerobacterium sp. PSU-2]|uniref:hypothetical protein n=1 Tax=Thermoanaerobacterium sp. PSU-2 TaxID=1930849 RepID=UPI000A14934F|nr:hypothetical protein [Thermoanaerobacterium sp. PSU-2]ORX22736.1 hypothetical protein BVF91_09665 [Thermoanaerobacterium sp. PSU-2]
MIQVQLKAIDTNDKQQLELRLDELENKINFLNERIRQINLDIAKAEKEKQLLPILIQEKKDTEEEYKILFQYYYRIKEA